MLCENCEKYLKMHLRIILFCMFFYQRNCPSKFKKAVQPKVQSISNLTDLKKYNTITVIN